MHEQMLGRLKPPTNNLQVRKSTIPNAIELASFGRSDRSHLMERNNGETTGVGKGQEGLVGRIGSAVLVSPVSVSTYSDAFG